MSYSTLEVPVSGGTLHAGVWGTSGPLVIAAHGITAQHRSYALIGPDLGRDHRVVALDLRGRGQSRALPPPYGLDVHAADVATVAEHFGEPAILLGHSMGAMVMARVARLGIGTRAVLVDGGPLLPPPPGPDLEAAVAAIVGQAYARLSMTFASHEDYEAFWRQHPSFGEWTDATTDYVRYDLVGADGDWHPRCRLAAAERDGVDLYNTTGEPEQPLPIPAIFLRAERGMFNQEEPFYPAGYAEHWLPGVEVRDVPDVNHYSITLTPRGADAVVGAVREG